MIYESDLDAYEYDDPKRLSLEMELERQECMRHHPSWSDGEDDADAG